MNNKKRYATTVFAIYALSSIGAINGAITPAIQTIGNAFPNVPYTSLLMISTLPSLIMVPISLLTGIVTGKFIKYKTILYIALLCMGVGGILPYFLTQWPLILAATAVFGVGYGVLSTLLSALVFNLVPAEKQAGVLGLQGTINFTGGMVFMLLGGVMATMGWRMPFLLFAAAFIVFGIVIAFLPEPEKASEPTQVSGAPKQSRRMPAIVWLWSVVLTIVSILYMPSLLNISTIFEQMHLSAAMAGTATTLFTVGCILAGSVFGKVFGKLGYGILPLGFALMAASQILMAIGTDFVMFAIGELLVGFGFFSAVNLLLMSCGSAVPPEQSPMAMAMTQVGMGVGTFLSGYVYGAIMEATGIISMRFQFWFGLVCFLLLTVFAFVMSFNKNLPMPASDGQE